LLGRNDAIAGTAESRWKAAFAEKERRVDVHGFQGHKKSLRESKRVHGLVLELVGGHFLERVARISRGKPNIEYNNSGMD